MCDKVVCAGIAGKHKCARIAFEDVAVGNASNDVTVWIATNVKH